MSINGGKGKIAARNAKAEGEIAVASAWWAAAMLGVSWEFVALQLVFM